MQSFLVTNMLGLINLVNKYLKINSWKQLIWLVVENPNGSMGDLTI